MKAVICRKLTGIEGLDLVADWPEPAPGEGEVLVEVRAAALNFPDLLMTLGQYQDQPELPFVTGIEFAGVVAQAGPGVEGFKPGDRVLGATGRALAERLVAPASQLMRVPEALDFEAAAGLSITYFTTMHAYRQRANLSAGESVLVLGAGGGVGTSAVELGKAFGATVIAAASSDEKLELARSLGADHLVNYATEDLRVRLKELTGGRGVDVVYDPVGGALAEPALRSLAWRGRYLVIGFASGEIPSIPLNLPLLKGCSVVGVYWGSFVQREPGLQAQNAAELWRLVQEGKVRPAVGEVHALEDYAAAFQALATRRARGKVIVRL
jgi:NADPH2:quinone reductase